MVAEIAEEFVSCGGKRLRPRLARAVYGALGGDPSEDGPLAPVCEAIECFHKASLIHDDIQDGDLERYGREALHVKVGVPMAIAVGDWLVAKGYTLIAGCGFDAAGEMLAAAAASHLRLCEGQAMELAARAGGEPPEPGRILEIFALKTGEAFALASALGAMAAGAGARIVDEARSFALDLGVAFQIDIGHEMPKQRTMTASKNSVIAPVPFPLRSRNPCR